MQNKFSSCSGASSESGISHSGQQPFAERKDFTTVDGHSVTVFPYKKEGKLVGIALESKAPGYGGDIGVIVGFDMARDTLLGIGITENRETPGIGTAVSEPRFTGQFSGKPLKVELTSKGGTINAISGATVSSVGTVKAVQNAVATYTGLKSAILNAWQ